MLEVRRVLKHPLPRLGRRPQGDRSTQPVRQRSVVIGAVPSGKVIVTAPSLQ